MLSQTQKLCIGGSCVVTLILLLFVLYYFRSEKESFGTSPILPEWANEYIQMADDLELDSKAKEELSKRNPL